MRDAITLTYITNQNKKVQLEKPTVVTTAGQWALFYVQFI